MGPRVLVVDSESADGTGEAAVAAGAEVAVHPFTDYASQRNFGLASVASEWVLMIDADERVSPALADEILDAIERMKTGPEVAAFEHPIRERLNNGLSKEKIKLSVGDFVTKAVALALRRHPAVNATFDGETLTRRGG